MRRSLLAALAGAAVLASPAAASAASATLTVKTERGYVAAAGKKAGMPAYKALYKWSVQFRGTVLNDAGTPANGAQVTLIGVEADGTAAPVDGPHLTFTDGTFSATFRADHNRQYYVHVDQNTTIGTSAVDSGRVVVGAAPRIQDTSPLTSPAAFYPIRGKVEVPNASHAGAVVLQRREGKRWKMIAKKTLARGGGYGFHVRVTTHAWVIFRISFVPKGDGARLYVTNALLFRVRKQ
jgi:hypothetical protein